MSDAKPRLDHLREMVEGAEQRMLSEACSDQNFAVLGRFRRDLLAEIEELDPSVGERPKTGLSEFERRLREREQSGSKASRRAAAK